MDGEDDCRRRQTTPTGLKTNVNSKSEWFPAMPHALDILAAIALIYGAGVLTGFNLARRVTGFMLGGRRS
jgi:hypothetical protein